MIGITAASFYRYSQSIRFKIDQEHVALCCYQEACLFGRYVNHRIKGCVIISRWPFPIFPLFFEDLLCDFQLHKTPLEETNEISCFAGKQLFILAFHGSFKLSKIGERLNFITCSNLAVLDIFRRAPWMGLKSIKPTIIFAAERQIRFGKIQFHLASRTTETKLVVSAKNLSFSLDRVGIVGLLLL